MTHPNLEVDDYVASLLADYEGARSDERSWAQLLGTLFGILVALLGFLAAALPSLDIFGCTETSGDCHVANGFLLAAIPVAPVAVLAFAITVGIPGTIRSYYMRALEREIRRVVGERQISALPDTDIPAISWIEVSIEATSLRRGRPLYRVLMLVIFVCVIIAYGGLVVVIFKRVEPALQAAMATFYSAVTVLLIAATAEATVGGRTLFRDVVRSYERTRARDAQDRPAESEPSGGRERGNAATDRESRSSLMLYLLYPRPTDIVKLVFVPASIVLFAALAPGDTPVSWHTFFTLTLAVVIFEGLLCAARYQVNDVRDYHRDLEYASAAYRGRLPAGRDNPHRRVIVLTSLGVAAYRVALAFTLVAILAPGFLFWEGVTIAALVVASTIAYEGLKALSRRRAATTWGGAVVGEPIDPRRFRHPLVWGVWLSVGAGYAIRGFVGWQVAELLGASPSLAVALLGLVFLFVAGIAFVTETWALEATSLLIADRRDDDAPILVSESAREKPHILALLSYLPRLGNIRLGCAARELEEDLTGAEPCEPVKLEDPLRKLLRRGIDSRSRSVTQGANEQAADAKSSVRPCIRLRDQVLAVRATNAAPWNLAFVASVGVGVAIVVAVEPHGVGPTGIVVSAIALVAVLASMCLSGDWIRWLIAIPLVAAAWATAFFGDPTAWAVMPFCIALFLDALFRTASHQSLVSTTKQAVLALASVPTVVARAVLGDTMNRLWPRKPRRDPAR